MLTNFVQKVEEVNAEQFTLGLLCKQRLKKLLERKEGMMLSLMVKSGGIKAGRGKETVLQEMIGVRG